MGALSNIQLDENAVEIAKVSCSRYIYEIRRNPISQREGYTSDGVNYGKNIVRNSLAGNVPTRQCRLIFPEKACRGDTRQAKRGPDIPNLSQ